MNYLAENKVAKNSAFYTIAQMLTKASGFLLIFIYTNPAFLSQEEYGRSNLLSSFVYATVIIINLSLNQAMIRYYAEYKTDEKKCRRYFGTLVTFMIVFGTVIVSLFLIFRYPLAEKLFAGIDIRPVEYTFITMLFNAVYQIYQSILQAKQQGKKYALNSILFFAVHVILNVFLLAFGKNFTLFGKDLSGINAMAFSFLVTNIVFAVYGVFDMVRGKVMEFGVDFPLLWESLKYSLPMIPYNLAGNMASYIPKHFLNASGQAAANGIYSVSMQFSSIVDIIQSSVNLAFRPWFNDRIKQGEEGKKEIVELADVAFRISCIVCLGVALYSQEVVILLNKSYYDAWKYVPLIAVANAVKFIFFTHALGIMYDIRQSKKMFFCSGSAIVINYALSAILTHFGLYGMLGAAVCFFISRAVTAGVSVAICNKSKVIKYDVGLMIKQILLISLFCVVGLVPYNVLYLGPGYEITLMSSEFFVNLLIKTIVFCVGTICVVGKKRKEVLDFALSLFKKKKKA